MKYDRIELRYGRSRKAVQDHQCDDVLALDTITEAKKKAKQVLTDDFQRLIEASEPMRFAQVWADDNVIAEYSRPVSKLEKANLQRVQDATDSGLFMADGEQVIDAEYSGGDWEFRTENCNDWFTVPANVKLTEKNGKAFSLIA